MITNFFSRAALAKVASLHSLQKPSLLSIGAECAVPVNKSSKQQREDADHGVALVNRRDAEYCQIVLPAKTHSAVSYSGRLCARHRVDPGSGRRA